jgi:hypothetical protein
MSKTKLLVPEMLPISPLSLVCPFCRAKPNRDCSTSSGAISVVHLARIKAAALQDSANLSTARQIQS